MEGLVSKGRTQISDKTKFRGKKENCFESGENGHFRRDCSTLKREK